MDIDQRVKLFTKLGDWLDDLTESTLNEIQIHAKNQNNWFTFDNITLAINGVRRYLRRDQLLQWISRYPISQVKPKKVGIVMAGNIPLVGFHDLLCVLISGHSAMVKMSSQDSYLMRWLIDQMVKMDSDLKDQIIIVDKLNEADAVIATGSDNTARYFKYYFGKKPHIIRQNRTSIAVLSGHESNDELSRLGSDIFAYFGLGCRNVSKVMVPRDYSFNLFFESIQSFEKSIEHHKYLNNYDYNKSIYLVNKHPHLDNGFLLVTQSDQLVSPISVLYYQEYENTSKLEQYLTENQDKIQCIVSNTNDHVKFGQAQNPHLWDYADRVDTTAFLLSL